MYRSLFLLGLATVTFAQDATLLITNGRVWTGNPHQPWAEAVAVAGDRILAVGNLLDVQKLAGKATRVIDAKRGMVVPGFIDSHVHFLDGGFALNAVQLRDAKSKAEFILRVKDYAAQIPP